jgi:hypothetical protein
MVLGGDWVVGPVELCGARLTLVVVVMLRLRMARVVVWQGTLIGVLRDTLLMGRILR